MLFIEDNISVNYKEKNMRARMTSLVSIFMIVMLMVVGCSTGSKKIVGSSDVNIYEKSDETLVVDRAMLERFFSSYKEAILSRRIVRIAEYIDDDFEGMGHGKDGIVSMIRSNMEAFTTYDVTLYGFDQHNDYVVIDAKVDFGTGITIYPKGWKIVVRGGELRWYGHPN